MLAGVGPFTPGAEIGDERIDAEDASKTSEHLLFFQGGTTGITSLGKSNPQLKECPAHWTRSDLHTIAVMKQTIILFGK